MKVCLGYPQAQVARAALVVLTAAVLTAGGASAVIISQGLLSPTLLAWRQFPFGLFRFAQCYGHQLALCCRQVGWTGRTASLSRE